MKGRSCCLQLPDVWPCQRDTLKKQEVVDTNFCKGNSAVKFFPFEWCSPGTGARELVGSSSLKGFRT